MIAGMSVLSFPAAEAALQCVPYARQISGLDLKGNAWTWWDNAAARYERGQTPQVGSALVFKKGPRMSYGHVSVVSKVVDSRNILVDHANWAPSGGSGRGKITRNAAVVDTSPNNDWSSVRVWYGAINDMGQKHYPTYGFIYPNGKSGTDILPASFKQQTSVDRANAMLPDALTTGMPSATASLDDDIASFSSAIADDEEQLMAENDERKAMIIPAKKVPEKTAKASPRSQKPMKSIKRPGAITTRDIETGRKKDEPVAISAKKMSEPSRTQARHSHPKVKR